MHVIVDENLPRRLVPWLKERGAEAVHVVEIGLQGASDATIWAAAEPAGAYVMTRDSDFLVICCAARRGGCIHLLMGGLTTAQILERLGRAWPGMVAAVRRGERIVEAR